MVVCNVTKGIKLTVSAILNGVRFFDTILKFKSFNYFLVFFFDKLRTVISS